LRQALKIPPILDNTL